MKRVLVTGAYGFIGRHVARELSRQNYEVRAIGHGAWSRGEWQNWGIADWYPSDITIESLITYAGEPDWIFHCAGSGSVAFSMSHPYQDYQRSVSTTHAVLEYIRTVHPAAALVLPSSAGVYGLAERMPINVNEVLNPVSPYGLHKKMAEDLCLSYGKHFGVRTAVVRLFSIFGVGLRKQLLWDACSKIAAKNAIFSGTGNETRDWLHVEDAAKLMVFAAQNASPNCPIVNGGVGKATSISEVVNAIVEDIGSTQIPIFSGASRPGDPLHYLANISEALAWGWIPIQNWRDNIRSYVHWFKDGAQ